MKSIKLMLIVVITMAFLSCNKTESLDKYYVTHQERQGFMTIDIPTDILEINQDSLTDIQKKAYKSVSKLNFLGFKKSASDVATFIAEKEKLKKILNNTKYQELIKFSDDGKQGVVKYLGTPNAIDELILFESEDAEGFAVVRVLGTDMNPQNIFELLRSIKEKDINTGELKKIASFFDNK